jgi:4-hydroxy-3-methylbut-2-enyl diphosphate reductase
MNGPSLQILLANPRGFCAGVDRAIRIVEEALDAFGAPIYVRHEIVHNRHVIESLRRRGVIFVESLDTVPESAHVVFSAHGVSQAVVEQARSRRLHTIDATCPLVSKVHHEIAEHVRRGRQTVLIGHEGHVEVEGTLGQVPSGTVHLVQCADDVRDLPLDSAKPVAVTMQTTLSVLDTADITAALSRRFVHTIEPRTADICYATTNRQKAVMALAPQSDAAVVIGGRQSSNSHSLRLSALRAGCARALLIECAEEMDWAWMEGVTRLALTSGASTPEYLVREFVNACRARYSVSVSEVPVLDEHVHFNLPRFGTLDAVRRRPVYKDDDRPQS